MIPIKKSNEVKGNGGTIKLSAMNLGFEELDKPYIKGEP
jgi:hypothetical protein